METWFLEKIKTIDESLTKLIKRQKINEIEMKREILYQVPVKFRELLKYT